MEFSVLPLKCLASFVQDELWVMYKRNSILSSSQVQSPFLTCGFKMLIHRSRHCFPVLPAMSLAACAHLQGPSRSTHPCKIMSSSWVHGPFIRPGRSILLHRWRHWIGVRPFMYWLIFFQFFSPLIITMALSTSSSSLDHFPFLLSQFLLSKISSYISLLRIFCSVKRLESGSFSKFCCKLGTISPDSSN